MSLYRKYRPQTFEDVVGQEHVAQTLRNALSSVPPRVAHAYLFCGPRGIGKTTNARLMAKCLNCEKGPTPTPCNECDFCVRVSNKTRLRSGRIAPDVHLPLPPRLGGREGVAFSRRDEIRFPGKCFGG